MFIKKLNLEDSTSENQIISTKENNSEFLSQNSLFSEEIIENIEKNINLKINDRNFTIIDDEMALNEEKILFRIWKIKLPLFILKK